MAWGNELNIPVCISYLSYPSHSVLPIVMGARPDDYKAVAPHHSFIHVDQFKGPRELAEYLLELDRDDEKYNQYFQWKGTGEFINTRFFCRVCAMMHNKKVGERMTVQCL